MDSTSPENPENRDKSRRPGSKPGVQDTIGIAGMLAERCFFLVRGGARVSSGSRHRMAGCSGQGEGAAGRDNLLSADTQEINRAKIRVVK